MTLHWWMHWFWITALATSLCVCVPVLPTADSAEPETVAPPVVSESNGEDLNPLSSSTAFPPVIPLVRGHRGGKAIGQPPPNPSTPLPYLKVSIAFPLATGRDTGDEGSALQKEVALSIDSKKPPSAEVKTSSTASPTHEESQTTDPTIPDAAVTEVSVNNESVSKRISISVEETTNISVANNITEGSNVTVTINNNTVNESVTHIMTNDTEREVLIKNASNIVEVSTARALLLETSVGRRAADAEVRKNALPGEDGGLDAGAVAGICFGSLVVLGLAGATSLVLYRRRYLNKPQTLNDKCSNPDSSGYIDDSTIRENSEEMYSLDNDSFLNSLEAMTIQNYWTDSVKHTKL